MANSQTITWKLEGQDKVLAKLANLKGSLIRRIVRQALNKAATPILKTAKQSVPVDTGLLKKSLGRKSKTYKSGTLMQIIGARSGFKTPVGVNRKGRTKYQNPTQYLHLVEFGTSRSEAKPFLGPALSSHIDQTQRIVADFIAAGVAKEAAK